VVVVPGADMATGTGAGFAEAALAAAAAEPPAAADAVELEPADTKQ